MDVHEVLTTARDAMSVRRVFGEPYERDGVTMIPAAIVMGGGGGGTGQRGQDEGGGGGFGLSAIPAGAYSIRGGEVRWHPAVNANLMALAAAVVVITWLRYRARR